jgi:hypothetical protein
MSSSVRAPLALVVLAAASLAVASSALASERAPRAAGRLAAYGLMGDTSNNGTSTTSFHTTLANGICSWCFFNDASSIQTLALLGDATDSTYGTGVSGSGSAYGVRGSTASETSVAGIYGTLVSSLPGSTTAGVFGTSNSTTTSGPGVYGQHTSTSGAAAGVMGLTRSLTASAAGVYGQINSAADYAAGVRGYNFNTTCCGFGVVGFHGGQGIGIGGYAPNGFGVFGYSPYNWAAWLDGAVTVTRDLHVNGTLYKAGGAFRIDNPVDPAHSYLQHSFVESPHMLNVYSGNVVTDAKGYATVRLPRWFQALNKDFRYQLTPMGRRGWDARAGVWTKVKNNTFTIRTSKPKIEVSWQLTGVRHDPYANAHRIRVVVPKTGADAGKYAHPRLYGQPAGKGATALPAKLEYANDAAAAPRLKTK